MDVLAVQPASARPVRSVRTLIAACWFARCRAALSRKKRTVDSVSPNISDAITTAPAAKTILCRRISFFRRYAWLGDRATTGSIASSSISWPMAGNWTGTLAADITYQGKRDAYFAANSYNIKLDPYTLINLRAAVSNGLWRGTLFVRNLTDKRAQVSAINSAQDPHALITVRPRTVGITVTRNF